MRVEHAKTLAEIGLRGVDASHIREHYTARKSAHNPIPLVYRYLFCNIQSGDCRQLLQYYGKRGGGSPTNPIHLFVCKNCKYRKLLQAHQLANNMNVVQGSDMEFPISDHFLEDTSRLSSILVLNPPDEPVYGLVDKQAGRDHYTAIVELHGDDKWLYWAKGLLDPKQIAKIKAERR